MTQENKQPPNGSMASSRQQQSPEPYNPFNMRLVMLQNMYNWNCANKTTSRSLNLSLQRNKHFSVQNPEKSLDLLRQVVQNSLNKEIDAIIQNYMQKFFAPAIINIRRNGSDVTDEQIHMVCRQILEDAKKMYLVPASIAKEEEYFASSVVEAIRPNVPKLVNKNIPFPLRPKRKEGCESDTESDISQSSSAGAIFRKQKRPKVERPPVKVVHKPVSGTTEKSAKMFDVPEKDLSKWDPDRVAVDSLFVLGSKANMALGLSAQRGRIYMRHPGLFRYIGDGDDKQWLFEHQQKTRRSGGKAFLLLLDDVKELAESAEYRSNPAVRLDDLRGFTLPSELITKIKNRTAHIYAELCKKFGKKSSIAVDVAVENHIPDESSVPQTVAMEFEIHSDGNVKQEF